MPFGRRRRRVPPRASIARLGLPRGRAVSPALERPRAMASVLSPAGQEMEQGNPTPFKQSFRA